MPKMRWLQSFYIGAGNPKLIGDRSRAVYTEKKLQYFDDETKQWVDVPTEIDQESREKAKQDLKRGSPWR
ncbi:MAG: hypothetical protein EOP06_18380 [Proteobacteria bacterium]|nr:MAG: hypothetical protein EOP06_18380 [Pseudomonadota bacterium]